MLQLPHLVFVFQHILPFVKTFFFINVYIYLCCKVYLVCSEVEHDRILGVFMLYSLTSSSLAV